MVESALRLIELTRAVLVSRLTILRSRLGLMLRTVSIDPEFSCPVVT
jgi:hypothetical protein